MWPGAAAIAAAAALAAAGLLLSLLAPTTVGWIEHHGVGMLFEGGRPPSYYAHWLRSTAACWSVLLPLLLLVGDGLRCWIRGTWTSDRSATRLLLVLALSALLVAALVPRHRTGDEPAYLGMAASLWRDGDRSSPRSEVPSTPARPPSAARPGPCMVSAWHGSWWLPRGCWAGSVSR